MQQALTESHGAHDVRQQELELMSDWVKRLQTSLQRLRRFGVVLGAVLSRMMCRVTAAVTRRTFGS
jgi:chromosome condensin MukBEF MukE localization factor